jgi:hypothetical protein
VPSTAESKTRLQAYWYSRINRLGYQSSIAVFIKGRRRREDLLQEVRKLDRGKVKTELRDVGETGEKSLNKIELT